MGEKTVLRKKAPEELLQRGQANVATAQRSRGTRGVVFKEREGNLLQMKTMGNQSMGGEAFGS